MADGAHLGPWEPLSVAELGRSLAGFGSPWWLMGGQALDRFVGRVTRAHDDIDVEVPRPALAAVLAHFAGWDPHTAHHGTLTPLRRAADQPPDATGIWFRARPGDPWRFDLKLAAVDGEDWVYRRHPSVRRPLSSLWWADTDGVAVIAPEVQLLFKARAERPKDSADAEVVVPLLDGVARRWLLDAVRLAHPDSPWLAWL